MAGESAAKSNKHERSWDSAFYRFAEGVRTLTGGEVNYKVLYSYVGTNGRYVNHNNALVRKRTAAAFSRLIHSSKYADDLRDSHRADGEVFSRAATQLVAELRRTSGQDDEALMEALLQILLDGVQQGLINEQASGRADVNRARLRRELDALAAWCHTQRASGAAPLEVLAAAIFHLLAYGRLDERFARTLLDATPAEGAPAHAMTPPFGLDCDGGACLIRVKDDRSAPLSGIWRIDASRPFTIGRYMDCDAIESEPLVSRLHCRIYWFEDAWYVEDVRSTHGTRVLRGDSAAVSQVVFDSATAPALVFKLSFGDRIELAGCVTYWFRSLAVGEFIQGE